MNILDGIREVIRERTNEEVYNAVCEERWRNIQKTAVALMEAGIVQEEMISLLQKHWNLRLSEAERVIKRVKKQK